MRALITGADGMLGSALTPLLSENGYEAFPTDINLINPKTEYLDVTDFSQAQSLINKVRAEIIFHLAAETNVDRCEMEPGHAYKINTLATKNLALICQKCDIPMIYISTCGVFDGKKTDAYNEFDQPNPISIYTKSKYEGEIAVQKLLKKYFIFRAGWMMGGGKEDKKFVAKIIEIINKKNILTVVNDKRGCPTFTKDFSQGMIKVIGVGDYGLYHLTNAGSTTRFDIACKIVMLLGRSDVIVKPISSDQFPLPAPRPNSEAVECKKIESLNIKMRPWEEALKDYLSGYEQS